MRFQSPSVSVAGASSKRNLAFFVQNNHVERLTIPVSNYARKNGFTLHDRSSTQTFDADRCGIDWTRYDAVIPYGSVQFLRHLKASALSPFLLHDEDRFATSAWAAVFGDEALNAGGQLAIAADLPSLLNTFGPLHLRPDRVDKAFTGGVHTTESWSALQAERKVDRGLACWVSPLQRILGEWRCWIVGGRVVEVSQYRDGMQMQVRRPVDPADRDDLLMVAQRFADRYLPVPCVVMDLALTSSGYKLIEFNPIQSSGWYAADVGSVLDAWVAWTLSTKR